MSQNVILSKRLLLRPLTAESAQAIVDGKREPDWADDYPDTGDLEIARYVAGSPALSPEAIDFGIRQVVEIGSGLVVGGIGFFGPPDSGWVEIGYGVVPSRQRRGYASEALAAMLAHAWSFPSVKEVRAGTTDDNPASQGVLTKAGFEYTGKDGDELRYSLIRP